MRSNTCFFALLLALSAGVEGADQPKHHHGEGSTLLQLDAGQRWKTDTALRESMATLRVEFVNQHHVIYQGTASHDQYEALATAIERTLDKVISQCQLEPSADAQLHIILGKLMGAAEKMRHLADRQQANLGAMQAINALNDYAQHFEDPTFLPLHE